MKVELLSPVGNKETLYQAIHNGADAIYFGGKNFGARKYADNFSDEEIVSAINYAHLYDVKVYITINTIIYQNEIEDFLKYVEFIYKNNVDAVIVQDIGMIKLLKEKFPDLEIHASTQCHNHNKEGIKFLKELGVSRVVLARELSLKEINKIDIDIEKEVFIHGALCVSYSGCCLFSSLNGGRSGNRGECVGSCRLPYKLVENDKEIKLDNEYLLSTRELNTINDLKELLDSNITSLKIEGRMKSPEYVGCVTKLYRMMIDKYYNNEEMLITEKEFNNLKKLYNRKFTSGYLFNDNNIMNIKTPNHQGVDIGSIISVSKKYIKIKLTDNLYQGDAIRFKNNNKGMYVNKLYDNKRNLTNQVLRNNIAIIDNKVNIKNNDVVLKTIDIKLNHELKNVQEKKVKISCIVKARLGSSLYIEFNNEGYKSYIKSDIITESKNNPISKETLKEKLSKLGNTPFEIDNFDIELDNNIFIPISKLNELRRTLVDDLIKEKLKPKEKIVINQIDSNKRYTKDNNTKYSILVRTEEQLKTVLEYQNKLDNIYVIDYNLYLQYQDNNKIYYRTPRVDLNPKEYTNSNLLVTELGSLYKNKKNNIVTDYYLNIVNNESIKLLLDNNVKKVTLSPEISVKDLENIDESLNTELIIYGRLELMITKYCPLKLLLNNCAVCKENKNKYYLKDFSNNLYPIIHDNCLTHIMHYKNIDLINDINRYIELGITNFRIELLDENYDEVIKLLKKLKA